MSINNKNVVFGDIRLPERFWKRVEVDNETGCWCWKAGKSSSGYGMFTVDNYRIRAHRHSYEMLVGPIPEGLQIDHLCRVRNCVNPNHLEAVTQKENIMRGLGISAINAVKTHCPKGHEYDEKNTYIRPLGQRMCRACHRLRSLDRYYRNKKVI